MADFTATDPDRELNASHRFEWERMVRRMPMSVTTRCVALLMASYGNINGSRIRPGRDRLARVAGVSPKTVSRCIVSLRAMGLLELLSAGSGSSRHKSAAEYRLTLPGDILDFPGLLGPDEEDPEEKGPPVSPANPVDNPVEGDTSVPGSPSSRGHLGKEQGTFGEEHGTPGDVAGDIAMSTYQNRPNQLHQNMTKPRVDSKVTSRSGSGTTEDHGDPWTVYGEIDPWPEPEKCADCGGRGFLGVDEEKRPIPCVNCRPHLARVIPLDERRTG